jgi:hypothetical protein
MRVTPELTRRRDPDTQQEISVSAVIAGDDERSAAALPLRSQGGFGDRMRSSQSYDAGA